MPRVEVKDALYAIKRMDREQLSLLADLLVTQSEDRAGQLATYIGHAQMDQFMIEQELDRVHCRHYVPERG